MSSFTFYRNYRLTYLEDRSLFHGFQNFWTRAWLLLGALAMIALPQFLPQYWVYTLNLAAIAVIVALGLNVLTGSAGQISLAHASVLAIGAYATAWLAKKGVPFIVVIPAAGAIAANRLRAVLSGQFQRDHLAQHLVSPRIRVNVVPVEIDPPEWIACDVDQVGPVTKFATEAIEGRPLDSRADLYSLGCTAFELMTGQPPYKGDTPIAVCMQHLTAPLPTLPDGVEGVAEWLGERRGRKVVILRPQRGPRVDLMKMAEDNAHHSFREKQRAGDDLEARLTELRDRLRARQRLAVLRGRRVRLRGVRRRPDALRRVHPRRRLPPR